ncbi:MAG: T9SS type A sorting domain-containing protein [Ignavibacteria bacterium]
MKRYVFLSLVVVTCVIFFCDDCRSETNFVKDIALIKDDLSGTTELIKNHLNDLGYTSDILNSQYVSQEILVQYRLTILCTGSNQYACVSNEERQALQSYIIVSHGKLIIEGGHLGYISAVFPFYLAFRTKVIKIDSWNADNGGDLVMGESNSQYNLSNIPNKLPATIKLNFSNNFDQDVCTPDKSSKIFYSTSLYDDKAGILVSPNAEYPQIINYFVNLASIANQSEAKDLLENSIYNLIGEPLGIGNTNQNVPDDYMLEQNYPNPFNPSTNIIFALPRSGQVSLKVYDALGRVAAVITEGFRSAGIHEVFFDASSLSSGIYSYILVAGSQTITKKMILIK